MKRKRIAIVSSTDFRNCRDRLMCELYAGDSQVLQEAPGDFEIDLLTTKDGDMHVRMHDALHGEDVYLLHGMGQEPWRDLAAVCIMAEHLKRNGAGKVTAVVLNWKLGHHSMGLPYRRDVTGSGRLAARMLESGCVDRLVTLMPTADMLSSLYPVKVEIPDISQVIASDMKTSGMAVPLVLAVEPDVLPNASELAQRLGFEAGLCQIRKDGSYASADVSGRDILLYTHHLNSRIQRVVSMLKNGYCGCINCYIPRLEETDALSMYTKDINLLTLSEGPYALSVPVEAILAKWILRDSAGAVFESEKGDQ